MADFQVIGEVILEGADRVRQQLDSIGKSGNQAFQNLQKSTQGLGANVSRATSSFTDLSGKVNEVAANLSGRLPSAMRSTVSSLISMGGAARGAGLAITALGAAVTALVAAHRVLENFVTSTATTAASLDEAAKASGTTIENFTSLGFAAEQSGTRVEALRQALARISAATAQAVAGGGELADRFQQLGIALTDAAGRARDPVEVFIDTAGRIKELGGEADRAAVRARLFGQEFGPHLAGLLDRGSDGIIKLAQEAKRLGIVLSNLDVQNLIELDRAQKKAADTAQALRIRVANIIAPEFTRSANEYAELLKSWEPIILRIAEVIRDLLGVMNDFLRVLGSIGSLLSEIPGLLESVVNAIPGLAAVRDAFNLISTGLRNISAAAGLARSVLGAFGITLGDAAEKARELGTASEEAAAKASASQQEIGQATEETGRRVLKTSDDLIKAVGGTRVSVLDASRFAVDGLGDIVGAADETQQAFNRLGEGAGQLPTIIREAVGQTAQVTEQLNNAVSSVDFSVLGARVNETFNAIVTSAQQMGQNLTQVVQDAINGISSIITQQLPSSELWQGVVDGARSAWTSIQSTVQEILGRIRQAASNLWAGLDDGLSAAVSAILSGLNQIVGALERVAEQARETARELANVRGPGAAEGGRFSHGGKVFGPGTSTSDSIPAWLSSGEWVIRAAAVRKYGNRLFHLLNSMRLPRSFVNDLLRGFSGGGLVESLSVVNPTTIKLAAGGEVTSGRTVRVDLSFGGGTSFELLAPRDVAERLERYAITQRVRRAGRKPSWA